jgi:hypothetical protein
MGEFYNIMLGYFFGFALGVGSALAVIYTIYTGGYKKAVEHSLLEQKPKRYLDAVASAMRRIERHILGITDLHFLQRGQKNRTHLHRQSS